MPRYLVVADCFVGGSRYRPRPGDAPIVLELPPGMASAALKLLDEPERAAAPVPPPPLPPPGADEGGDGHDPRIDEVPSVEIPDDWAELHHRKVIALAQRILPGAQPGMTLDEAKAVITEELERRAR